MKISAQQLLLIAPDLRDKASAYAAALSHAMESFSIDTPKRAAYFLAQVCHESGHFTAFRENLNYSANSLLRTWPKRFVNYADASFYERQPIKIANYVYANRMGNGDEKSGDGWKYRGAGWLQTTGKTNHLRAAEKLGLDPKKDIGDQLSTINGAADSAALFWLESGCNRYADMDNIDAVSDIINKGRRTEEYGDSIGFAARASLTKHCLKVMGC